MPALHCSYFASSPSSSHTYYTTGAAVYLHKQISHRLVLLFFHLSKIMYCSCSCLELSLPQLFPLALINISLDLSFSSIHISRKSWHTLLNTCFHIAMTTAIYAGGISLTSYPVVCQAVSAEFTQSPYLDYRHVS